MYFSFFPDFPCSPYPVRPSSILSKLMYSRAILSAGPYHDITEEGKFYAVVLEQMQVPAGQDANPGSPPGGMR